MRHNHGGVIMLSEFQEALNADKSLNFKHVPHYIRWVRECYNFFRTPPTERLPLDQTRLFLTHLEKSRETWQIKQAEQALRRFDFFLAKKLSPSPTKADNAGWEDILCAIPLRLTCWREAPIFARFRIFSATLTCAQQ